jgi:branched-subunit amino acid ABC-type transport system permease component
LSPHHHESAKEAITTVFSNIIGPGIADAAILVLSALAMTLQHSITRHANFAHGAFLTMAAYMMVAFRPLTGNLYILALLGVALSAAMAWAMNTAVLQPFRNVTSSLTVFLIVTFALETTFENSIAVGFGLNYVGITVPPQTAHYVGPFLWTPLQQLIIVTSVVVVAAVFAVLKFTPFGREQRAVADDVVLAKVVGIKANRVISYTWLLTGALAGLAGVALGTTTGTFDSQLGFNFLLLTFAAVIVGGLGRPLGAVIGALIIGVVTAVTGYYISSGYAQVGALIILLLALLLRPQGLLKSAAGELRM